MKPLPILVLLHWQLAIATDAAGPKKLLLVDDHEVLYRAGLKRVLEPLQRETPGVPVISKTEPWESLFGYVSVHLVGSKLHLYYQCYSTTVSVNGSTGVCLATSEDNGKTFDKPKLDVFKYAGEGTNVVYNPGPGFYFGQALYEPNDPDPQRRWKMVFWHMEQKPGETSKVPGLYTALSADGVHWQQHGAQGQPKIIGAYGDPQIQPPLVSQNASCKPAASGSWNTELSESDAMNVMWDPRAKEYRVYSKTWIDGIDGGMFWKRAVMLHTSADFDTWAPLPGLLCLHPDEFDVGADPVAGAPYLPGGGATGVELHAGPVAYLPDAELYVMLVQHLDWTSKPNGGNLVMELALSRGDGKSWTRPFRDHLGYPKFFNVNPVPNKFDSGTMWTNAQFIPSSDGKTQRLFYGAYQSWDVDESNPAYSGIGVAEMTTDRFAGLAPINQSYPGAVTLKPVDLSSICKITANVDTTGNGELRVELMSAQGYRFDGYDKMNATVITNISDTGVTLTWKGKTTLPSGLTMLRAHLFRSHLYAFTLHPCPQKREYV